MTGEEALHKEAFLLAYHLHWSREDILRLPIPERQRYLVLLQEQLQQESERWTRPWTG